MKNLLKLTFFASLFLLFTASCSDEDENTLSIIGVYTLTEESVSGCNDSLDDDTEIKTCTTTDCETLTISGDGTFTEIEVTSTGTVTETGSYSINGNQITFTSLIGGVSDSDVATFSLVGSTLTLTYAAEDDGCTSKDTYSKN